MSEWEVEYGGVVTARTRAEAWKKAEKIAEKRGQTVLRIPQKPFWSGEGTL